MFNSTWWSIKLPESWVSRKEKECFSFFGQPKVGVLQVSAARNNQGPVTWDDLSEFAANDGTSIRKFQRINVVNYSGLYCSYIKDNYHWKEWWLKKGSTVVYLTYNVEVQFADAEQRDLQQIVESLSIND